MAHTVELLSLINDYPEAFVEPSESPVIQSSSTVSKTDAGTDELLSLMSEFPEAFAPPEEEPTSTTPVEEITPPKAKQAAAPTPEGHALDIPQGYEMALHQTISTFGWGQVQAYLRYENQSLQAIWLQVGKSGTEVQSFCEAIARLSNRLLAAGTPVVEIVKELRGIRGGDSEGLGPHRFLGLVDLFGKILQEAPASLSVNPVAPPAAKPISPSVEVAAPEPTSEPSQPVSDSTTIASTAHQWVELSDSSAIASLCPECGAELQQVNGCSGGACVVCGYSSCS